VRQSEPFDGKIGGRLIALAILATLAAILFSYQRASSTIVIEPQPRQQRGVRPKPKRGTQTQVKTASSFTSFKHESHRAPKTKLNCSNCHTIPSREAPDEVFAATKASIKGYPYHDSCLDCHRRTPPQFFSGAAPAVCTVCHTRSSPHLTVREVSPFPKQGEEAMELEFPGYFPHDQRDHKRAKCETCHTTDERAYVAIPVGGSEMLFKPPEGTFKTSPFGHASCFKCHWKDEKPTKDDCAGCHLTPAEVAKKPRNLVSANAMEWFKSWPREWPKRLSLKFNHGSKDHDEECTTCHDLAKIETLDILKAEVPIATCAKSNCHFSSTSRPSISKEMYEEDDDIAEGRNNNPGSTEGRHTCTGCHTTAIGSMPPPCNHYVLFDDTYMKSEDYPKSAKQIAERCKK
jgi:hypothetical protein